MRLTDEELAAMEAAMPALAARYRAEQAAITEDDDEPVELVDAPIGAIVRESAEGIDQDSTMPAGCPACLRGAPRAGAPHTCGLPNPFFPKRDGA